MPSKIASVREQPHTRRLIDPPIAFIKPTSFLRSTATLLIPAITHSEVSNSTSRTVAVSSPLMRP